MTSDPKATVAAEPPARASFLERLWPRSRISIAEAMCTTAVLACDFAWFSGWLAIFMGVAGVVAVRHALSRPIARREVWLALLTVAVVDACFVYDQSVWLWPVAYISRNDEFHFAWFTIGYLAGLMLSMLPVGPGMRSVQLRASERVVQLIGTGLAGSLLILGTRLWSEYIRDRVHAMPLFPIVAADALAIGLVLLQYKRPARDLDQVTAPKVSLLEKLTAMLFGACFFITLYLLAAGFSPTRVQ